METQRLDWNPLHPREVAKLMARADILWWIGGGWALDLCLGSQTREHEDTDIQILRRDQLRMGEILSGWDLYRTGTHLTPWDGGYLGPELGADSLWCRRRPGEPWNLQVMFLDACGDEWIYRRNPAVRGPLAHIGRLTPDGLPYLAPEVQLLYKGGMSRRRPKDDQDFWVTLPHLSSETKAWLAWALAVQFPAGHDWLEYLR